jgi:mono/diheme cytochrome c family protein
MNEKAQGSLRMRKILLASVLVLICISIVFATMQKKDWVVPEEAKALKNPVQPSEAALKAARTLYADHCAQCHGETGKGDGSEAMMYDPAPADLTDAKRMARLTDGEIFYQISEGKDPMPAFKKRMTEEQRWQLVVLARSLSQHAALPDEKKNAPAPDKAGSKN